MKHKILFFLWLATIFALALAPGLPVQAQESPFTVENCMTESVNLVLVYVIDGQINAFGSEFNFIGFNVDGGNENAEYQNADGLVLSGRSIYDAAGELRWICITEDQIQTAIDAGQTAGNLAEQYDTAIQQSPAIELWVNGDTEYAPVQWLKIFGLPGSAAVAITRYQPSIYRDEYYYGFARFQGVWILPASGGMYGPDGLGELVFEGVLRSPSNSTLTGFVFSRESGADGGYLFVMGDTTFRHYYFDMPHDMALGEDGYCINSIDGSTSLMMNADGNLVPCELPAATNGVCNTARIIFGDENHIALFGPFCPNNYPIQLSDETGSLTGAVNYDGVEFTLTGSGFYGIQQDRITNDNGDYISFFLVTIQPLDEDIASQIASAAFLGTLSRGDWGDWEVFPVNTP